MLPNPIDNPSQDFVITTRNGPDERIEVLNLLLNTYVEMVKLKSTQPGECSHMLAHHTAYIQRQIGILLKELR